MKRFCFLFTFIISYLFASSIGTWTIYHTDKGVSEYYVSNWTDTDTVINGLTYHEVFLKNFKIRFDGDKVYQYLCDTQEEVLIIDMGLQKGDTFKMRNGMELIAKDVKDTTINFHYSEESRKCIHLQGKNDANYTDVWIEGIGSIRYGYFPENEGRAQRLLAFEDCVFTFNEDNIQNLLITPGEYVEDETLQKETLNMSLQDGTLYIDGCAYYDGCGLWYLFVVEKNGVIDITYRETPLDCDGRCLRKFSAKIEGFEGPLYEVYFGPYHKEFMGTLENKSTQGINSPATDEHQIKTIIDAGILTVQLPYISLNETITLYDSTGRVVATQTVQQGATTATIDVATLPAGVYIARLNSGATTKVVL